MKVHEWIARLESEGFTHIHVVPIPAGPIPEHTHDKHSVHVILEGELTIITQDDGEETYYPGDRVEFLAGTTHKARGGEGPGSMLVGILEH